MTAPTVLLVEDSLSMAELYSGILDGAGYSVRTADTIKAARAALEEAAPTVMLLDLNLPDGNGLEVLAFAGDKGLPTSTVVLTAHGSVKAAVSAMQAGAADFLVKPVDPARLKVTVANAVETRQLRDLVQARPDAAPRPGFDGFIGSSPAMQQVYRLIDAAAPSKATVFITGESGTGKEVCAEALHRRSPRMKGPFVPLNCGAIPKDLIESEIFGHAKGAFTGATADRAGAAQRADGGTLFLDEIGEMDPDLQTKLLRFLQTGSFTRVGGSTTHTVDIRIVCATNRDPWADVQAGRFREDLYYRLHVIPLHLPPLREREGDALEIAETFLGQYAAEEGKAFASYEPAAAALIAAYPWPGNVRQLQNIVRNVVVLHDGQVVRADMLPAPLADASLPRGSISAPEPAAPGEVRPLWQVERAAIQAALAVCDGNVPKAAALLEISPSTVYRKLQTWTNE